MVRMRRRAISFLTRAFLLLVTILGPPALTGCEREERVLDVQTPEGSLHVDRNVDTGEVDVEVHDND